MTALLFGFFGMPLEVGFHVSMRNCLSVEIILKSPIDGFQRVELFQEVKIPGFVLQDGVATLMLD